MPTNYNVRDTLTDGDNFSGGFVTCAALKYIGLEKKRNPE
jgi:hypothetical protein